MMISSLRKTHRTRAQAMVEMALILPLVIGLLFAILDFGYYLYVLVAVGHATREGVRNAAMNNRTRAEVKAYIRHTAAAVEIPATPVDAITITTKANDPEFAGSPPSVTATVSFEHEFLVPLFMIGRSKSNVYASSKMIIQTWETAPHNKVNF